MQRHLFEKMRYLVVGVGRMPLEYELAGSPEADKIAGHQRIRNAFICHCTHNTQKLPKTISASTAPTRSN